MVHKDKVATSILALLPAPQDPLWVKSGELKKSSLGFLLCLDICFLKKLILTLGLEFLVFSFEKEIGMGP